jgi:signal transduction histidine kinase
LEDGPIDVEVRADGGAALVGVRDHGIGIPPERRAEVFERFVQIHGGRHYGGLGVGLYVSQQIAGLHGGRIEVEAPEGGGTRFVLKLPLDGPADGGRSGAAG